MEYLTPIFFLFTFSSCTWFSAHKVVDNPKDCAPACAHLKALGCPEGEDNAHETCEEFCMDTLRNGHPLELKKILVAKSCDVVR